MTGRRARLLVLALVGAAQLAVPLGRIAGYERTLSRGTPWRFRVAPVDPADAFRGRYLALGFEATAAPLPAGVPVRHGSWAYLPLSEDAEGFARLGAAAAAPPAEGDYLRVRALYTRTEEDGRQEVEVELPFDRLYLPEGLAPAAEERLRRALARPGGRERVWAVVRVRDGRAALEDLVIDGESVRPG